MKVVEMMIQEIYSDKQAALEELDKRYDAIEKDHGFPPKKRLWSVSGAHTMQTLVILREWESMAAMESAYESSMSDPGLRALHAEGAGIVKSTRIELYAVA